jgi:hypothetical protein
VVFEVISSEEMGNKIGNVCYVGKGSMVVEGKVKERKIGERMCEKRILH